MQNRFFLELYQFYFWLRKEGTSGKRKERDSCRISFQVHFCAFLDRAWQEPVTRTCGSAYKSVGMLTKLWADCVPWFIINIITIVEHWKLLYCIGKLSNWDMQVGQSTITDLRPVNWLLDISERCTTIPTKLYRVHPSPFQLHWHEAALHPDGPNIRLLKDQSPTSPEKIARMRRILREAIGPLIYTLKLADISFPVSIPS
jgi:hypothetical protein